MNDSQLIVIFIREDKKEAIIRRAFFFIPFCSPFVGQELQRHLTQELRGVSVRLH
jgi:hypothetical protein